MCWSELDRERGVWTLPAERSKNHRSHVLPLPSLAWDIIEGTPRLIGRDHVFGSHSAKGFTAWQKAKTALDARLSASDWNLHDLRRSMATGLANLGVAPHVDRVPAKSLLGRSGRASSRPTIGAHTKRRCAARSGCGRATSRRWSWAASARSFQCAPVLNLRHKFARRGALRYIVISSHYGAHSLNRASKPLERNPGRSRQPRSFANWSARNGETDGGDRRSRSASRQIR